jgi:hypothetical protein
MLSIGVNRTARRSTLDEALERYVDWREAWAAVRADMPYGRTLRRGSASSLARSIPSRSGSPMSTVSGCGSRNGLSWSS